MTATSTFASEQSPAPSRYTAVAKGLHWLIALVILGQWIIGINFDNFEKPFKYVMINRHSVTGSILLLLVLFRIVWRLTHRPPALPATMPSWQQIASKVSHFAFYALMLAVPIAGLITRFARGGGLDLGFAQIPSPLAKMPDFADQAESYHGLLATALIILAAVHVLTALGHYFFWKDGVMQRMLPQKSTT